MKVPIASTKTKPTSATPPASTSTTEAVAKSTPLIHALTELIMSKYDEHTGVNENLSPVNAKIQTVFNKFPVDSTTERLAAVVEAMTGFRPAISQTLIQLGDLVRYADQTWLAIHTAQPSGNVYFVGSNGMSSITLNGNRASNKMATFGEAGLFAKQFLSVNGPVFIDYVGKNVGGLHILPLLKAVGIPDVL